MRDFLKYAAASAVGAFVSLVALIILLGFGAVGLFTFVVATASRDTEPQVEDKSLLVFDLSIDITNSIPPTGPEIVIEEALYGDLGQAVSLQTVLATLDQAANDDRIVGLLLQGNTFEGLSTLREVREGLARFKATGKPIFAYEMGWAERDYYLVSVADSLILNPAGILELNGFSAETQFLAGALQKYGVGVQVLRAGRYKSAVEPFIRTESSPEEREQTQALLTDLWQEFLTVAAAERSLTPQQLQQIADTGGLLMADEALQAGLVDEIAYFDEVLADLRDLTESDADVLEDFPQVELTEYGEIAALASDNDSDNTVAVVYAEGEIVGGESAPGLIGSETLTRLLRELRQDEGVKAIVLRINSPGGGATASELITREVELAGEVKPLMVSMGDLAASGGYMMAAPGDKIFATPTTITGSIGVFGLLLNLKEIANENGITWDVVKTAEFADIGTIARPQSPQELALQQDIVNTLYSRFLTIVSESRDMTTAEVDQVAQGRVWSGTDAAAVGLVDEIGGLDDAIAAAASAAELEDWIVEEYPQPRTLEEQIFESLFGRIISRLPAAQDPLTQEVYALRDRLRTLGLLGDPRGFYTRIPFTTTIK
ncbi:signal peptide peptidase SppA [Sphaerothrix gracilis]|uniref:signal peptide peptidase SppA n=1 Tax=Sphaerothrix gracilis TaxID=3151835 RepID=UPI0031FC8E76